MRKIFTSLLIFIFVFFIFSVTNVSAKVIADENGTVTVAKTEIINDDLFIGAKSAEIDGTINGDVFVGAETVRINGTINGNLHVGAGTVNLGGTVKGNAYIGASQVNVSGLKIEGSLLVGSGSLNVDKDSSVGGSIIAGVGTSTFSSPVKRNMYIGAGSVYINSTIGGEVRIGAGNISIGSNTKIAKDLYYATGGKDQGEINISDMATVSGAIHKSEYKFANQKDIDTVKKELPAVFNTAKLFFAIISFIGALIIGYLYLRFFGKQAKSAVELISKSFWKSLGVGLLIMLGTAPVLLVLLITAVGIPLAGMAFLLLMIYMYLAKIVVGIAFGSWLSRKFNWKNISPFAVFAFGLFAIYVLKGLPFIGIFVSFVVIWSGLGALTLRMFSKSD